MDKQTLEFFEWQDIQSEICKEMDIDKEYFRDYNKLVGGDYKDLWHIWIEYFQSDIHNGSIVSMDCGESLESISEWISDEGKEWAIPFVEAVYRVWDKFEIENVKYSW
tara:strand:- start:398 stop:721 length:324 start_codon:yes stop_codon:yes gene_type:complete